MALTAITILNRSHHCALQFALQVSSLDCRFLLSVLLPLQEEQLLVFTNLGVILMPPIMLVLEVLSLAPTGAFT